MGSDEQAKLDARFVMDLIAANGRFLISDYNASHRDAILLNSQHVSISNADQNQGIEQKGEELLATSATPEELAKLDCQSVKQAADIVCSRLPGITTSMVPSKLNIDEVVAISDKRSDQGAEKPLHTKISNVSQII